MPIPAASDTTEELADWLELEALKSVSQDASLESLIRIIRRSGTTDAIAGSRGDQGSEESQRIGSDAFSELGNRQIACGTTGRYPFEISQGLIRLKAGHETSPYVLLLLLSDSTPTAGHDGTAALFEHICRHAAQQYLGGVANGAGAIRFGTPRRAPLRNLGNAVDDLCRCLAEGGGCRSLSHARHSGDDGLDIVAWKNFPDGRAGKIIAFGQCATGDGWEEKLTELDGASYARKWFRDPLVVEPLRLFFLPRRIPREEWTHAGIDGGILFDRCRIVACLDDIDVELTRRCDAAASTLLKKLRAPVKKNKRRRKRKK